MGSLVHDDDIIIITVKEKDFHSLLSAIRTRDLQLDKRKIRLNVDRPPKKARVPVPTLMERLSVEEVRRVDGTKINDPNMIDTYCEIADLSKGMKIAYSTGTAYDTSTSLNQKCS